MTTDFLMRNIDLQAQRAMGLAPFESSGQGIVEKEREVMTRSNEILGFN